MLKPEQVSEAVAKAAWTAFYNATGPTVVDDWRAAIAAALNAWPRMYRTDSTLFSPALILPLPQENPDAET